MQKWVKRSELPKRTPSDDEVKLKVEDTKRLIKLGYLNCLDENISSINETCLIDDATFCSITKVYNTKKEYDKDLSEIVFELSKGHKVSDALYDKVLKAKEAFDAYLKMNV